MKTIVKVIMVVMTIVLMCGLTAEAKTLNNDISMKTWIESITENDQEAEKIWRSKTDDLIANQIEKTISKAKEYKDIAILKEVAKFATDNYWEEKNERYLPYVSKAYDKIFQIEAKLYYMSILENKAEYGVAIKRIGNTILCDFGNKGKVIFILNPENEIIEMHS